MDAINPSREETAPRKEQAKRSSEQVDAEAASKTQAAAQAKTEELRNALQTKGEQGKRRHRFCSGRRGLNTPIPFGPSVSHGWDHRSPFSKHRLNQEKAADKTRAMRRKKAA
jgi:hypothetical protein